MHVILIGRVQGVGMRSKTKYLADQLHLTGFVRNVSDGSVEICAQGKKTDLEVFLRSLLSTFDSSYIHNYKTSYRPMQEEFSHFTISYSK